MEVLHLDYGESSLIVQKGKGNKKGVVRVGGQLKSHLKKYIKYHESDSPYLFTSSRGDKLTVPGVQQIFKRWYKKMVCLPIIRRILQGIATLLG